MKGHAKKAGGRRKEEDEGRKMNGRMKEGRKRKEGKEGRMEKEGRK